MNRRLRRREGEKARSLPHLGPLMTAPGPLRAPGALRPCCHQAWSRVVVIALFSLGSARVFLFFSLGTPTHIATLMGPELCILKYGKEKSEACFALWTLFLQDCLKGHSTLAFQISEQQRMPLTSMIQTFLHAQFSRSPLYLGTTRRWPPDAQPNQLEREVCM